MKKNKHTQKEINDARNEESDEAKDLINEYCAELTDKEQPEACDIDAEDCGSCGS